MADPVLITLSNGLRIALEPVASAASVAMSWLLPMGSATEPESEDGYAAMLVEMMLRGAGGQTSREHSDALDRLGVQRATSVQTHHIQLAATMMGAAVDDALPLLAAMVLEPALPDDAVEPVRSLCLQTLAGLEDDPQHQVMLALRARHRPAPLNRHGYGREDVLRAASGAALRESWGRRATADGSILCFAGDVDPDALVPRLESVLAGFGGEAVAPPARETAQGGYGSIEQDTAQVHLAVAWDAPAESDPESVLERVATAVLSGSTSGRLFSEVRQKRSLCYSVGASYRAGRDDGAISLYAGTTPERAPGDAGRLARGSRPAV